MSLLAVACSVQPQDVAVVFDEAAAPPSAPADTDLGSAASGVLPAVGPVPGSSNWHAAYVVRICGDVLTPFTTDNDPLGIHTHGDGLIHIHPFFAESGFEHANLGLFADAMGMAVRTGELTLPGGGTWRDGDLCDGQPGRVFVDRWEGPDPATSVERIFDDPDQVRFVADGELYQIAFAPVDSPPVVPPSVVLLPEVSNLITEIPEPWVRVADDADPASVEIWTVDRVSTGPCTDGQIPESVLSGAATCFERGRDRFGREEAVVDARAVLFNRQPAVELTITPVFRAFILSQFTTGSPAADTGLVLAVEVDGAVVTAPLLLRPSASEDRLVVSGGFSVESAEALARVLTG